MNLPDNIPNWPNFLVVQDEGRDTWRAFTNTGRPKTPIFQCWLGRKPDRETAESDASKVLNAAYRNAHPRGCPNVHDH